MEKHLPKEKQDQLAKLEATRKRLSDSLKKAKEPQKAGLQTKLKNNNLQINKLATQEQINAFKVAQKQRSDLEKKGRWTMISKASQTSNHSCPSPGQLDG
jgi:hypothetical protein